MPAGLAATFFITTTGTERATDMPNDSTSTVWTLTPAGELQFTDADGRSAPAPDMHEAFAPTRALLIDARRRIVADRHEDAVAREVAHLEAVAEAERRLSPPATATPTPGGTEPKSKRGRWSKNLSPKMRAAYVGQLLMESPNATDSELAEQCGVSRRTVQRWHADPVMGQAWYNIGQRRPKAVVDKGEDGRWLIDAEAES